jgi:hypothetical protein
MSEQTPITKKSNVVFYIIIGLLILLVITGISIGIWKYMENKKKTNNDNKVSPLKMYLTKYYSNPGNEYLKYKSTESDTLNLFIEKYNTIASVAGFKNNITNCTYNDDSKYKYLLKQIICGITSENNIDIYCSLFLLFTEIMALKSNDSTSFVYDKNTNIITVAASNGEYQAMLGLYTPVKITSDVPPTNGVVVEEWTKPTSPASISYDNFKIAIAKLAIGIKQKYNDSSMCTATCDKIVE